MDGWPNAIQYHGKIENILLGWKNRLGTLRYAMVTPVLPIPLGPQKEGKGKIIN